MFEEVNREIRKLCEPRTISVEVTVDDKGYYDRLCPSSICSGQFKVLFEDWKEKVPDERAFCPFCGHEASGNDWDTPEQETYLASVGEAEMGRLLDDALGRAVRRTRPQQIGGGFMDVSISLSHKPGLIPPVIPATASDELEQEFMCEECGCRYASLGASFFCPACGHNSAVSCFEKTLETVRKTISAVPELRATFEKTVDADASKDGVRQILEDQIVRLTGAFERLNEALFDRLPNESRFPRNRGVFQRLHDASMLWKQATGTGYDGFLTHAELERLNLLFQRRHVLSHRQGIVDQTYVRRSGDKGYQVGQRLIVCADDVLELAELTGRLASELTTLATPT